MSNETLVERFLAYRCPIGAQMNSVEVVLASDYDADVERRNATLLQSFLERAGEIDRAEAAERERAEALRRVDAICAEHDLLDELAEAKAEIERLTRRLNMFERGEMAEAAKTALEAEYMKALQQESALRVAAEDALAEAKAENKILTAILGKTVARLEDTLRSLIAAIADRARAPEREGGEK